MLHHRLFEPKINGSMEHLWAWLTPTPAEELNTHRKATVAAVWALCAGLRAGVEAVHLSRAFRRHWAACGAVAVWDSHDAATLAIQNIQFQKKNAPRSPVSGPFGAFDFSTRIKEGGRKRPPPGHKAPQCGAFPAFEGGAPFRHSRWF
ncbi:hypothetical protein F260042K2_42300 [Flavonifractor plautii]